MCLPYVGSPSIYLSLFHPSIHPSIHLSIYLSIYLSTYLPTYLPIYLHIYLSIFLFLLSYLLFSLTSAALGQKFCLETHAKKRFLPNWANCAKDTTANGRQQIPEKGNQSMSLYHHPGFSVVAVSVFTSPFVGLGEMIQFGCFIFSKTRFFEHQLVLESADWRVDFSGCFQIWNHQSPLTRIGWISWTVMPRMHENAWN